MERRYRLAPNERFQQVRCEGRSWSHPLLVLFALTNELPRSRFGFVVSKRVGNAVVRNRAKRLMREAARVRLSGTVPGWDLVLVARGAMAKADVWRTGEALDSLLDRAGLLAPSRPSLDTGK